MRLLANILLCCFLLFGDGNKIQWSPEKQLVWKDFKGDPKLSSKHGAISNIGLSYDYKTLKNGDIQLTIIANFYKKDSWVKPNDKTESLLAHENLHFDIAEIYIRKMRKAIMDNGTVSTKNVNKVFREIYQNNKKQYDERQFLYDTETNHSKIEQEQNRWSKIVSQELLELSAYQEVIITIKK